MKWYKHDPDAFAAGVAGLSLEEVGAYILLLDAMYARDGNLPDDDQLVASILRCNPRTWRKVKTGLLDKGKIWRSGSNLTGKRVERTLNESRLFSEIQSKRAKKRWNSKAEACQDGITNTTTTTSRKKERVLTHPKESAPAKRTLASLFPEDWTNGIPSAAEAAALAEGFPTDRVASEWQRFQDSARAHGRRYVDWLAAWRNWLRSPYQQQPRAAATAQRPQTFKERRQEEWHDVLVELRQSIENDERKESLGTNIRLLPRSAGA